jgi:peroxygenase
MFRFAAKFEWSVLYLLCARDGLLHKEDVRGAYDGSLFYRIEAELHEKKE